MLGSKTGGESTGRPGAYGMEAVVTTVGSVAVVQSWAVGGAPNGPLSPSALLTEVGGLLATSSDLRRERTEEKEVDRSLSVEGLVIGGGMLMEERSAEALVVSTWAALLRSGYL